MENQIKNIYNKGVTLKIPSRLHLDVMNIKKMSTDKIGRRWYRYINRYVFFFNNKDYRQ